MKIRDLELKYQRLVKSGYETITLAEVLKDLRYMRLSNMRIKSLNQYAKNRL